ncbi:protein translocase subunit SecD [candidate division WWE3 bacterium]|uniref:Protein translocase subunit SecD n=1 Tax=candidate division WWE3 bacterium TaxID=2053526 RepID=A0A955RR71_UNCKA|nr:protein translocase subunit SecD [candidate division WWE3 bacterium]
MKRQNFWLFVTFFVTITSILIALPRIDIKFDKQIGPWPIKIDTTIGDYDIDMNLLGIKFQRDLRFLPGLDLQGGIQAVLEADLSDISPDLYSDAIGSAKQVVERRVNYLGVVEPNIYTSVNGDSYRIIVELPGVTDTQEVLNILGQTAQLDFREETEVTPTPTPEDGAEVTPAPVDINDGWTKTELTGKYLQRAQVVFDQSNGLPLVQITFDSEGAQLFEDITSRNVGKRLAIFLDEDILTAPTVQQAISGGQATISGQFTTDEANNLAVQLNAGALPVPVTVVQQKNIGPTLGQETINKSIFAGLVGLLLVAVFMLINYRVFGIFSIVGLGIYGAVTMAIYKYIPVTLTLSGIAGFILSIGMAVDANILIFERIREELRSGKDIDAAIKVGFTRAWDSIRDANTATLITVFVLFNPMNWSFLVTSGTVRGFALTLGIGVLVSLFTGVVVTRVLIYQFYPRGDGLLARIVGRVMSHHGDGGENV